MSKEKHYEFVSWKVCQVYLSRTTKITNLLVKRLKSKGISSITYTIGSAGKRHLVTRLVIDGKKQPFDIDVNLEIDETSLPQKYKDLTSLKELVRSELNKSIKECGESFSDGCNSTSAITVPLYNKQKILEFSFDLGIVSRNRNDDLQRLVFKKNRNIYKWEVISTTELDFKFKAIRNNEQWNKLRDTYLRFKNQFINDKTHPSYVCYKMAINEVYQQFTEDEVLDGMDFDLIVECVGEFSVDNSLSKLNTLYQRKLISKPLFKFPEPDEDSNFDYRCECFISSLEKLEGYWERGIGEAESRADARKEAAYDLLDFLINGNDDDEEEETPKVYTCPYCGSEKPSEDEPCPVCFDDDDTD
ncbi:MAG: hypothetical protein K6F69_02170 [Treponema sp.]|nr:hypothetical protein [Treponema sp.]